MLYIGEAVGFADYMHTFIDAEKEYAALGYRTISVDDFILWGGYGESINHLVCQPRVVGEKIKYHGELYQKYFYLSPVRSIVKEAFEKNMAIYDIWEVPSTKNLED